MIVSFSQVYFGNFSFSLEFCAELFPLSVEVETGRVVTLIEVDDEGISGSEEGAFPVSPLQQNSV
jgi:hypothetical protein